MVGATNADTGGRGFDQIVLLIDLSYCSGNGAKAAFSQRKQTFFRAIFLSCVVECLYPNFRVGSNSHEAAVFQCDLG